MPKTPIRVLVIEDDAAMAGGIVRGLKSAGFEVELANDGVQGATKALAIAPDIVVLDLLLPRQSGFEVLEQLRGRVSAPVIILTAKTDLQDRLRAFDLGAADFLVKPFWIEELVARIRARLTIDRSPAKRIVRWADAEVDLDARRVEVGGLPIALTRHEFDMLAHLLARPARAVSREQLAGDVLSAIDQREPRTVDTHIARIRRKLGPKAAESIATVWGIGYRFEAPGDQQ